MPIGSSSPSRNCPICGERLWDDDRPSKIKALLYYNDHIHAVHPGFERWNRRLSRNYLIAVFLLFGAPAVAVVSGAPTFILGPFVAGGFLVVLGTFVALQKAESRFRRQWNREHGSPVNPQ